ncbi:hypothetical protein BGZ74_008441 [Mortierella antarctica]|nr:hypothetical protein BGZ74_008441 [Mortierella antarctica]
MQALTPLLFSMLFPRFSTKPSTQDAYDAQAGYAHLEQHESLIQNAFEEGYPIQTSPVSPKHKSARRHHSMGPSTSSGHKIPTSRRSLPARPARPAFSASSASLVSSSSSTAINSETDLDVDTATATTTVVVQQKKTKKHLSLDTAAYRATYPSLDGLGDTGSRPSSMEWFGPFVVDSPQQQYQTPSRSSSSSSTKSSRLRKSTTAQEPSMLVSRMSTSSVCSLASDVSSSSSTSSSSVREPLTPTTRSPNYRSVLKDHPRKGNKKNVVEDLCMSPESANFFHEDNQQHKQDGEAVVAGLGISASRGERQLAH